MSAHSVPQSFKDLIGAFRSPTFSVFRKYNAARLPRHRVAFIVKAIGDAEAIAFAEFEKPGRIQQSVRREAQRLFSRLDDAELSSVWRSPDPERFHLEIHREVRERAWRNGEEIDADDLPAIRRALAAVADGKPLPPLSPDALAFAARIGATPETAGTGGGRKEQVAFSDIVLFLACIFNELTGRKPGYSDTGEAPEGTFRAFVADWVAALGHPDKFRAAVGTERRMREAVVRWGKQRVHFEGPTERRHHERKKARSRQD